MILVIPQSKDNLGGPFVTAADDSCEIFADRNGVVILHFHDLPVGIDWVEEFTFMYCRRQHDPETVKVIREATDEELKLFRVPVWIQDPKIPNCCDKSMHFVGQIDDDRICTERPAAAKRWWHDRASFYVFTCDQCLKCRAVGQQF